MDAPASRKRRIPVGYSKTSLGVGDSASSATGDVEPGAFSLLVVSMVMLLGELSSRQSTLMNGVVQLVENVKVVAIEVTASPSRLTIIPLPMMINTCLGRGSRIANFSLGEEVALLLR